MTSVVVNAVAARAGAGMAHLSPFLQRVAAALPNGRFDVYVTSDFQDRCQHDRVRWVEVDIPAGMSPRRLLWDVFHIPRIARSYDAVLSPLNFGPIWSPKPHILLQRNALYFDREYISRCRPRERFSIALYRWMAIIESNGASCVIVPTEAMGKHLRRLLIHPDRLHVAGHGIDSELANSLAQRPLVSRASNWARADVRLLHIGVPGKHKGLDVLARTLAEVRRDKTGKHAELAVTFEQDNPDPSVRSFVDEVAALGLTSSVHYVGRLDHAETFALYRAADVFLFPSSVESFGNPILEAFAVGTPVVASALESITEVSGGHALLHPVNDHRAAALLVSQALTEASGAGSEALASYAAGQDPSLPARIVASEIKRLTASRAPS